MEARDRGYRGREDYRHGQIPRAGILLVNLGTPAAPNARAVRRFLAEFLNDPRVIELPAPLRRALVHGVVLRVRPRASARAYREIWCADGSPLLVYSRALEQRLRDATAKCLLGPVSVALAMRYGAPTVERTLRELVTDGVERLLVLPLYPQYSGATTGSAFDAVASALAGLRWVPAFRFVNHYHDDPGYIAAVAASVRESWSHGGRTERLLFSFHGMPRATLTAGDPYHCQCHASARLVAQSLQLEDEEWTVAFQSRFGRTQWLGPASDETLSGWARSSVKTVTVVCPGFAVDCLETLEEVNLRYRKAFLAAGGERFDYVPALNDSPAHVRALSELIVREMTHWPEAGADYAPSIYAEEAAAQARQARKLGAPR